MDGHFSGGTMWAKHGRRTLPAMEWRFSDDTVVRLGGHVEGDGPLAKRLRDDLELLAAGFPVTVVVRPQPGGDEPLDVNDPRHVASWTGNLMRFDDVRLLAAPKLPAPPTSKHHVPGAIY